MGVRKNYRNLTDEERDRFVQALYHVKATGIVDRFADIHRRHFDHLIHRSSHFLPWHREMLLRFERELQTFHPDITIPYWDSTVDSSPSDPLWNNSFLGQFNAAWNLRRALGSATLPTWADVEDVQRRNTYHTFWYGEDGQGLDGLEVRIHSPPHSWVEGVMGSATSPGDPVFYLHHCWIDFLWARWQDAHPGAPFVSSGAGADLNDPLMEWPDRTPADVLDYVALGYTYMLRPPTTAGNPMGYVGVGGARVVYRSGNRRINEQSRAANQPWYYFDMNVIAGAQLAEGDPMGYVGAGGARVVYRGVDNHVHELSLAPGAQWNHFDMNVIAGAQPCAGNPMGYVGAGGARVVYRGVDGHIHELSLAEVPGSQWLHFDMNVIAGAQLCAGYPMGYVGAGAARVVYRGVDDRVHELYLTDQWYHYDMTP